MIQRSWPLLLLLGCVSSSGPAGVPPRQLAYGGWGEAYALEAPRAGVTLIAVPPAGGRIVSYALDRENILFENPDYLGKTLATTPASELAQGYIGYNVDLGPELRRIPPHLRLWMGPYAGAADGASLLLTSEADPAVSIRIEKRVTIDPETGALGLVQTMTNTGSSSRAFCLWDRTLCQGGGFALVPLAPRSRFKAGWSLLKDGVYGGDCPSHPRVALMDGVLVAHAGGTSAKLGVDSRAGWIAYVRGRILLVKYFPVFPEGTYTDGGNSVEVYFDPKVCELEPLSPEQMLQPGQSYTFPERWTIVRLDREVTDAAGARALVPRIPDSPWKK
jgi:hypothetical protein